MNPFYDRLEPIAHAPVEETMSSVCVLFADDDRDTLGLMEQMCKQLGWHGKFVTSAMEVINAINGSCDETEAGYDAIVADINFNDSQGVTGITVARTIRKVRPDLPIIFVSGYVNSIVREEARRVNAEVFSKPTDLDSLFLKITRMIYWHRVTSAERYEGPNKRILTINTSGWARRRTDKPICPPKIVIDSITEDTKK